jgi:hypothetical protein
MKAMTEKQLYKLARDRAKAWQAIRESDCDQRAGKLLALLWGVVHLTDEILVHKKGCNCPWHKERQLSQKNLEDIAAGYDVNLTAMFYREVMGIGAACEIFANSLRSTECTQNEYKLLDECVEFVETSWMRQTVGASEG